MSGDTVTGTTERSEEHGDAGRVEPGLAVLLECDRPAAGGGAVSLAGVDVVRIGRGAERRARREGRVLHVELPDVKVSSSHAAIAIGERAVLRDLGSSNGTFVGAARLSEAALAPGEAFRVGHTFLAVLDDAAPIAFEPAAPEPWPFATLHGAFRRDLDRLQRVAATNIPVLILGETGTGKEVLASAVHQRSGRPGRFVAVNCGALPQTLVESLLFGHRKGAFSGAVRDEPGFVRQAHGGTLFLDEIGDLPLSAQATLLRVLQEREVTPVGAFEPTRVDVRVLAATHRPLEVMVRRGRFRADLYSRLSGVVSVAPPLRDRRCDLGTLVARVLGDRARGLRVRSEAGQALLAHGYPHNVRELVQALEAALVLSDAGVLRLSDLPAGFAAALEASPRRAPLPPASSARAPLAASARPLSDEDRRTRDELARRLAERGGNLTQVARDMGKARQQIQRWMRRFGLGPDE